MLDRHLRDFQNKMNADPIDWANKYIKIPLILLDKNYLHVVLKIE